MKDAEICVRTDEPDYFKLPEEEYNHSQGHFQVSPQFYCVTLSNYVDANLYHDMLTYSSLPEPGAS